MAVFSTSFQDKATLIKIGENFLMYICIRKLSRDLVQNRA
jgi:hypothetical protein